MRRIGGLCMQGHIYYWQLLLNTICKLIHLFQQTHISGVGSNCKVAGPKCIGRMTQNNINPVNNNAINKDKYTYKRNCHICNKKIVFFHFFEQFPLNQGYLSFEHECAI